MKTMLVVLVLATGAAPAPRASDRTDAVTLANGDHFTGEIVRLSRGRLELKTDDAGTIEIEWEKIVAAEAVGQFDVATSDGRHVVGSLRRGVNRFIVIATADGFEPLSIHDITALARLGASFWSRLDGSVDAGFTYTRSSGIAQVTLNTDTEFRRPSFLVELAASAAVTDRSDGRGRDDRGAVTLSYARYLGRRWFIAADGGLETNESLGLVLRSQIGGLGGLRLVNTNHAQLAISSGLAVNDEQAVDAAESVNVEGMLSMKASYYTYDRPRTNLDASVRYYPSLSHRGRQRLQIDSSVKRELWKDFFCSFDVYDTFDSAPPNPVAFRNDVGIVFALGWYY